MAKGENIFKRKDGRWEARYIKGHEVSGKIKYGFCYGKTYREAKEKAAKCRAELLNGKIINSGTERRRMDFYCDEWLKSKKNRIKESTYIKYETILTLHIKPKLGLRFPIEITSEMIQCFSDELLEKEKLSPKTVKDIMVVFRSVLQYATKKNPEIKDAFEIPYPREERKVMRVLSREEQKHLILYLTDEMDDCKFGILLALYTGIRIGELCALRWENISLEDKTIRITGTIQRLKIPASETEQSSTKTRVVINSPKSSSSLRIIPLTDCAAALCQRMYAKSKDIYILTRTKYPMEPRTLQYRLKKYTDACGLEGVHFHTLRHTFATRCVEVGFEIKSLSEILGHSSTTVTLERYVHSSIELKRDNMNKLEKIGL